ncbi:hypothetical protein [Paraburkholderia youngii]|uniref:Uncharacterized protein n=2 Tax=Paraburkholderia youngii TaxID=2782701 RepID=A0ABX2NGK5_9BURK|nr:hypothetical protein [Paraburkholderia youngii]NUX57001.1 hypothetical protein [Paraburkholderia youngii]NVI03516.1 hypothetical protein [Paraburkholderia youngii]
MFQLCVNNQCDGRVTLARVPAPSRAARLESKLFLQEFDVMKTLLAVAATVLLFTACAGGGAGSGSAGSGSISMYGTIDQGITFHN